MNYWIPSHIKSLLEATNVSFFVSSSHTRSYTTTNQPGIPRWHWRIMSILNMHAFKILGMHVDIYKKPPTFSTQRQPSPYKLGPHNLHLPLISSAFFSSLEHNTCHAHMYDKSIITTTINVVILQQQFYHASAAKLQPAEGSPYLIHNKHPPRTGI